MYIHILRIQLVIIEYIERERERERERRETETENERVCVRERDLMHIASLGRVQERHQQQLLTEILKRQHYWQCIQQLS